MKQQRIFVSGGAGVIGQEMVPLLVARGATVMVGDLKPRPAAFDASVRYRQGDLNTITCDEIAHFGPDVFIHLAATFERSIETYGFWNENFWHNIRLSHHLMSAMKDLPSLKRVVFASSYLIYDQARYQFPEPAKSPVSLTEDCPISPRNLTGMAKLAHEIELQFLGGFRDAQFTSASARIFRGYGCNSRDVISRWVRSLLVGEAITVYRAEGLFDYIYARDTAEGLIRLAERPEVTGIVNLGTGRARRVSEVVDVLRSHFPEMRVTHADSDILFEGSQADLSRWQAAIDWTPEYAIERAIPEIIEFERARQEGPAPVCLSIGHVLVTSASRKVPLVRALQAATATLDESIQVIAGDVNHDALTRYVASDFWEMPHTGPEQVDALLQGCAERGIGTIIPTRDGELEFWADHADRFERAGIRVLVSPSSSVLRCTDKLAFAEFGVANGLPFIPTATTLDGLGAGPFVVKERFGAGARSIALNVDRDAALSHAEKLAHPVYQPFIPGREISVDAWLDRTHHVKGLVLRTRDVVVAGESQVTTTFRDAAVERQVTAVLESLQLCGPVVLQVIIEDSYAIQVIECNARFGGASTTSIAAGLDMFRWSLLDRIGVDLSDYPFERIAGEVRQVRVPSDVHVYRSGV